MTLRNLTSLEIKTRELQVPRLEHFLNKWCRTPDPRSTLFMKARSGTPRTLDLALDLARPRAFDDVIWRRGVFGCGDAVWYVNKETLLPVVDSLVSVPCTRLECCHVIHVIDVIHVIHVSTRHPAAWTSHVEHFQSIIPQQNCTHSSESS